MSTVVLNLYTLSDLSSRSVAEASACVPGYSSEAGLGPQADPFVSLRDDRHPENVPEEETQSGGGTRMIDIENYTRSIAWMKRNLLALQQSPDDKTIHYAVLQSFEVTFNLSEEVFRKAFVSLETKEGAAFLSFREVIYRANDEGLGFITNKHWLEYGLALESIRETFSQAADLDINVTLRSLLSRYVDELERFASTLERKLVARA